MNGFAASRKSRILLDEKFNEASASRWVLETDGVVGETRVLFGQGKLDAQSEAGYTLWYRGELSGDYSIEYRVSFVQSGAAHERLSDLNCFWSAYDPQRPEDFFADSARRGAFASYNQLHLYYVGYGGNDNTTTRFRKYCGSHKDIITEYTDKGHLLAEGAAYNVRIEMQGDQVRFFINGEQIVDYLDENRYRKGYFGFRSIMSHVQISHLRIVQCF